MSKKPLIKGIGKLNVDLVFDKLPRLPEPGEELYAASFEPLLGGGVPSMLYHAASFGAEIELLTYIGKGYFSEFVREKLAENRIAYRNLMPDGATGSGINVTSVMLTPGERSFVTCSDEYTASDSEVYLYLKDADAVIVEYGKYLDVYKKLRRSGKILIGDFGYSPDMDINEMSEYLEVLDYYLPNELEARKLTGKSNLTDALTALSAFVPHPVVTLASKGAAFLNDGITVTVNTTSVTENGFDKERSLTDANTEIVDATGAGDAFTGGFCFGVATGCGLERSIRFGHAAAGGVVMKKGCY